MAKTKTKTKQPEWKKLAQQYGIEIAPRYDGTTGFAYFKNKGDTDVGRVFFSQDAKGEPEMCQGWGYPNGLTTSRLFLVLDAWLKFNRERLAAEPPKVES